MTPEENALAIMERAGEEIERALTVDAPAAARSTWAPGRKLIRLQKIADRMGAAIAPNTPCRKGCAHCCHMSTWITQSEAEQISAATGREPARIAPPNLEDIQGAREREVARWMGVPCTFLGPDNACTIYEVRPLACRTHHSLADTPEPCDIIAGSQDTPALNLTEFTLATAEAFLHEPFADIRDFFPTT